jgi:galactitol-specific phosphotransferase system IIB component
MQSKPGASAFDEPSFTCTMCPRGTYKADATNAIACKPCGTFAPGGNYFSAKEGSVTCEKCPAGSFAVSAGKAEAVEGCMPCPVGQYGSLAGGSCQACPANSFCPSLGTTAPTKCIKGTARAGSGSASDCIVEFKVKAAVTVQGITVSMWQKYKTTYETLFRKAAAVIASGDTPGSVLPDNIVNIALVEKSSSRRRLTAGESQVSFEVVNPPTNSEDNIEAVDASTVTNALEGKSNANSFAEALAGQTENLDLDNVENIEVQEQVNNLQILGVSVPQTAEPTPPPSTSFSPTPEPTAPSIMITSSAKSVSVAGVITGCVIAALCFFASSHVYLKPFFFGKRHADIGDGVAAASSGVSLEMGQIPTSTSLPQKDQPFVYSSHEAHNIGLDFVHSTSNPILEVQTEAVEPHRYRDVRGSIKPVVTGTDNIPEA